MKMNVIFTLKKLSICFLSQPMITILLFVFREDPVNLDGGIWVFKCRKEYSVSNDCI